MANNLLTIDMITREAVALWHNSNAFLMSIDRQYDNQYSREGAQIGSTLRIRLPNDYTVSNGPALSVQSTANQYTTLTMATQRHIDVSFNSVDMTLKMQDFSKNILAPMVNNLTGNVAKTIMNGYTEDQGDFSGTVFPGIANQVCNLVKNVDGSGAIISPTAQTYLKANAALTNNSRPAGNKPKVVNSPNTVANTVATLSGLLNPQSAISEQYYTGQVYDALGLMWMEDPTVTTHTSGTFSAGGTVNGGDQTGTTISINATTGTLKKGDIITFANVYAVNRITKTSTGSLRQFVVMADVSNGGTSVTIYPSLIPPAANGSNVQYQTVTASPADGAAMTLVTPANTTYQKNLAFAKEAITMVTADLVKPPNTQCSRHAMDGISLRLIKDYYLPGTDQSVSRLDVLFGWTVVRPEWACIIADQVEA